MVEQSTNLVKFYRQWVKNDWKSEQEGRPLGDTFDFISIRGLGQDKSHVKRKSGPKDQMDYPREWDLYQRGLEQVALGTPLNQWPVMDEDSILRLNSHNIHTIEAVANLSDAGILEVGTGARELQKRAKKFIEDDSPKAAAANLKVRAEKLTAENEALQTRIGRLEMENEALRETIAEEDTSSKRGPGRPKKAA